MAGFFNPKSYDVGSIGTQKKISQCGKCGLLRKCISPNMDAYGSGYHKILFIGSAPSLTEDRLGEYCCDEQSEKLKDVLNECDVDLEDCSYITALQCYTPKVPDFQTTMNCKPSLMKIIKRISPRVIVTLGEVPLKILLSGIWKKDFGDLDKWLGWKIPLHEFDSYLVPTYSLSHVIGKSKDPIFGNTFRKHIKTAISLENKLLPKNTITDLEKKVEIITSVESGILRLKDLAKKEGTLAFDYETTGLKPDLENQRIVSVSFCLNGVDTFAIPVKPETEEYIRKILLNPKLKKIASNMKFEERWTKAKLGCYVRGWYWDTMLAAHCLDNRSSITSVKFQSFIYFGIGDYDSHISPLLKSKYSNGINSIMKIGIKELLLYNGLDSLLEHMVMVKQRKIMLGAKHDTI